MCISINLTGRKRRSTFLSLITQRGLWKNSGLQMNCFKKKIPANPGTRLEKKEPVETILFL